MKQTPSKSLTCIDALLKGSQGIPGRVSIQNVSPQVPFGHYAIKRSIGDVVRVEVDLLSDGHDDLAGIVRYKHTKETIWQEIPLSPLGNDRWQSEFVVKQSGCYLFGIQAWVDHFSTWQNGFKKKVEAKQNVDTDILIGAQLIRQAQKRSDQAIQSRLAPVVKLLEDKRRKLMTRIETASSTELFELMCAAGFRPDSAIYEPLVTVVVDRRQATYSTWYELFPRSCASRPGQHGTFHDCIERIPYIAAMGFDVLYLPPVHPIGRSHRKGKNNTVNSKTGDPGSPWAIGSAEGGHKSIHPKLGTLNDFHALVKAAHKQGIEIALDIAFQCSPDHPYVCEHPDWFTRRPDGTIQYAENPPKKYQDIYPLYFSGSDWRDLWQELRSVFVFWIEQGVQIFRVDNPHTKPFSFWEWVIAKIKHEYPDVLFLAEAFTRPKVMYTLAALGFTQSYTYFTWRTKKWEIIEYFNELNQTSLRDFFRPNLFINTPDILHASLQQGGRPSFITRLVLAATLGASYGIYGPAFELGENTPREAGSEEYLNSEKYEIRFWDIFQKDSLCDLIARVNNIRKQNQALQDNWSLHFHHCDNDQLLVYSKQSDDHIILVVVNLDAQYKQSAWVDLNIDILKLKNSSSYQVVDLLTHNSYTWHGARNYVELDPHVLPAHIFRVELMPVS